MLTSIILVNENTVFSNSAYESRTLLLMIKHRPVNSNTPAPRCKPSSAAVPAGQPQQSLSGFAPVVIAGIYSAKPSKKSPEKFMAHLKNSPAHPKFSLSDRDDSVILSASIRGVAQLGEP